MTTEEILGNLIIILIIPLIFGIIFGLNNKITVFKNYDDLWLVFLSMILPVIFFFLFTAFPSKTIIIAGIIIEVILLVNIIFRTFEDNNRNIFATLLALYTKLPLSALFIFQLVSYLSELSKPAYRRNGGMNLFSIICLTPLILRLVKNKSGLLS